MKKNLLLFAVLAFLLIMTYFFQEKKMSENYEASQVKDSLVKTEISQLKLSFGEILKKNGQWWYKDNLLSHNFMKQIERKISQVKKIKKISGEWTTFFNNSNSTSFEVNHTKWTIGQLSLDKQGFYVALDSNIFLAIIDGESTHLTRNEEEIEGIKLNELLSLISRPLEELKENQLFRFYPNFPLSRVTISSEGSLAYELDLEKNQTIPAPIHGVEILEKLDKKLLSLLTQMTIKTSLPFEKVFRFKKLSEIHFRGVNHNLTWELWLTSKNSADAVVIDTANKRAYQMVGGTLKLFFIPLQDYWDKKIIPSSDFNHFSRLKTTFFQKNKSEEVIILNREPLAFESKKYKVQTDKMDKLFQFIFNLGPYDQADRISLLSKSEKKQLLSGDFLRIEVMDQDLIFWKKSEELIVVNVTQGFKAHFSLGDENLLATFEDVLK